MFDRYNAAALAAFVGAGLVLAALVYAPSSESSGAPQPSRLEPASAVRMPAMTSPEAYVVTPALPTVATEVPVLPEPMPTVQPADTLAVDGGLVEPASIMEALSVPCATEDSANCYWRADLFGNGTGESFVNIEGHIFPLASVLEG